MLRKTLTKILKRRHFWRTVGFSELSELYLSMMFRNLALSLVGVFVPIYLHQLGYAATEILSFYGFFFTARLIFDYIAGFSTAHFGPKHTMAASYVFQVVALGMLTSIDSMQWPLWLVASIWGSANSLFFIAYHVDFSKVKHSKHGGKELGFMTVMERGGAMLGPVVGGFIATIFGAQYTFLAATMFFVIGTVPLFMTSEPTRTRQKFRPGKLKVKGIERDLIANSGLSLQHSLSMILWPLFMALFIVQGAVFAKVGVISSLAVIAAVGAAQVIGKLIDNRRGRFLLRYSTYTTIGLQFVRPFLTTFNAALGLSMVYEFMSVGYRMPFFKAVYDRADSLPGNRIAYIVAMESVSTVVKATVYWFLAILAGVLSMYAVLTTAFVIAGFASSLILVEKFSALNPAKLRRARAQA